MAKVLSSISGNLISAASAGYAPTNSADVSAIASGYQVVSSTATQLYAGTAFLTEVNGANVSASRAGQAANASMANSAYYDGTGRLISALPDSAAVSSIASSYAESAVSGKLDTSAQVVTATAGDGTYVTSINGMGISGQGGGGAQVVTATGSASAASGIWPVTTSYLVSSINGSSILPYGYSSLSANSANWNNARTAVTANSANWNSVYNTVSSNSASWSGSTGGGSVTSPSGTILVTNGNEVEGTNSAVLTANGGEGFEELLFPQNQYLATNMLLLTYGPVPDTGATLMMPLTNPSYTDIRVVLSGRDTGYVYTSASGIIPSGALTASIPMDAIVSDISAAAEQWIGLAGGQLTAKKEGGILVTGVGELAWKSAVDNVTNTVSANSASWGAGATLPIIGSAGTDSATYGETSVEFNRYDTAGEPDIRTASLSPDQFYIDYTLDGNGHTSMMLTESILDFADSDGDHIVDAYSIDSWNSAVDTVANNSASWGQGGVVTSVESGTSYTGTATAVVTGITGINGSGIVPPKATTGSFWNPVYNTTTYGYKKLWNISLIAESSVLAGRDSNGRSISKLPDSATVSAIASSYAESAVSSKLDSSASSSFYTTANESGYVDSAYVGSAVDSAVSSYQPLSGMSAYESSFSAGDGLEFVTSGDDRILQVEAPVDIVAGPGIVIDNPDGNTLRVSVAQDVEVVLYSNNGAAQLPQSTVTLSENASNFEKVVVMYRDRFNNITNSTTFYTDNLTFGGEPTSRIFLSAPFLYESANPILARCSQYKFTAGNTLTFESCGNMLYTTTGVTCSYYTAANNQGTFIYKVVGVHRIAGGN